jgi:hypothetical protein
MHTIQQLQLELADARGRSGSYTDESHLSQSNPKDVSSFSQNNGRQLDVNGTTASNANNGALQNGNADNALSFASTVNVPNQVGFLVTMFFFLPLILIYTILFISKLSMRTVKTTSLLFYGIAGQLQFSICHIL